MTDIPELTESHLQRAIPARLRTRLMQGRFESGEDIAALRTSSTSPRTIKVPKKLESRPREQ